MTNKDLTQNEKDFIMAYYYSVADTLNFSTLTDVNDSLNWDIKKAKGVFGSLTKKGLINPKADLSENNEDVMGNTEALSELMNQGDLVDEFGFRFESDNQEYDYLHKLEYLKAL